MFYSRHTVYAYVPNFVSIGLFCRPVAAKKNNFCQFLRFFGLRHLVLSPIGNNLTKLNTGAQLQTFPYPTASKSFLYANAFMAKSGAQSLTYISGCISRLPGLRQRFISALVFIVFYMFLAVIRCWILVLSMDYDVLVLYDRTVA